MISKEQCIPGNIVVVNNKNTKDNLAMINYERSMGKPTTPFLLELGLQAHLMPSTKIECISYYPSTTIKPTTQLEILSKPKKDQCGAAHVQYKIVGKDQVYATFYTVFKYKVDMVEDKSMPASTSLSEQVHLKTSIRNGLNSLLS